jgi:hypothetical protein
MTTRRNMLSNVIGMMFLYPRDDISRFRACTEEIIEHLFGWLRQIEKEVTIAGMANWADRMQSFFAAAVRSNVPRGGKSAKG